MKKEKRKKLFSWEIYHLHSFRSSTKKITNRLSKFKDIEDNELLILKDANQQILIYELAINWPKDYHSLGNADLQIKDIENRLLKGNMCFIIKIGNEISHFQWLGFNKAKHIYSYMKNFKLKSDEAIWMNAYTYPAFRGKKLLNYTTYRMAEYLDQKNYNYLFSNVGYMNLLSLVFHIKYFDFYGILYYLRISYLKKYILLKQKNI